MKGIQRIRQLMKKEFVDKMVSLGFEYNLKKDIFYREYNDMWQVIEFGVTTSTRSLYVEGFITLDKFEICEYLESKIERIKYAYQAVASQPYMKMGSITTENPKIEKSDKEILDLIDELYQRIEKKLIPYLNRKKREEIESDKLIPDLRDWIRSVDIFTYLRKKFMVTPVAIKTKEEFFDLKFVALYLLCFHS